MDIFDLQERFDKLDLQYGVLFEETLDEIAIENKVLKNALKSQMTLQIEWESMAKLWALLYDDSETLSDEEYAHAYTAVFNGEKYREISTTEAKERAKANPAYKNLKLLQNKIRHKRDECRGILDAVHSRKYILNNMTQSLISNVDNVIL